MYDDFIASLITQLEQINYSIETNPMIPGVRSLLYAKSLQIKIIGPIKFFNHFLFVDWENDHFGQLSNLLETRKKFSEHVNKEYKVSRAWRVKIPNLAVIVLSQHGFSQEATQCAINQYFIPWQGGEVGQIILLDLNSKEMIHHYPRTYKQTGSIPLGYAVQEIRTIFEKTNSMTKPI